jgi:hypothetical protein
MDKKCFKCGGVKNIDEFYAHPQMADGHLGKCKECTKRDVYMDRVNNPEKLKERDRIRGQTEHRREQYRDQGRKSRERHKEKYAAHYLTSNAIRDRRLIRGRCEVCGSDEKVEAHHPDYMRPLEVRWLCFNHHREIHDKRRLKE